MKKVIISLILVLMLSSCSFGNKQEQYLKAEDTNKVNEKVLSGVIGSNKNKKGQDSIKEEEKNKEFEKRKAKIEEIKRKIRERNQRRKLEMESNKNLLDIVKFCKNLAETDVKYISKYDDVKNKSEIGRYVCGFNYTDGDNKKMLIALKVGDGEKLNFGDFVSAEVLVGKESKNIKVGEELVFLVGNSLFGDYTILENFNVGTIINFYGGLTIKIKSKVTKNKYLDYVKEYSKKREEKSGNYNEEEFKKTFDLHKEEMLKYSYPNNYKDGKIITTIHFFPKDKLMKHSNTDRELIYAIIYELKLGKGNIIDKNKNFRIKIENNERLDIEDIIKQIFISGKLTIGTKISLREVYLMAIGHLKNIEIEENNLKKKKQILKEYNKNSSFIEFCRNIFNSKEKGFDKLACIIQSYEFGTHKYSDEDTSFTITKMGNGKIIKGGDFVKVYFEKFGDMKELYLPGIAGEFKQIDTDSILSLINGMDIIGLPIGTEGYFQNRKIILSDIINKDGIFELYLNLGNKLKEETKEEKERKMEFENELKSLKKEFEEKVVKQIKNMPKSQKYYYGVGGFGIALPIFDKIVIGKGKKYGDYICLQDNNEYKKFKLDSKEQSFGIHSLLIVEGKLDIGTKMGMCANGHCSNDFNELVDMKYCDSQGK